MPPTPVGLVYRATSVTHPRIPTLHEALAWRLSGEPGEDRGRAASAGAA